MADDADGTGGRPRSGHYDWMASRLDCSACSWSGFGRDARMGEVFEDGEAYHCPSCDAYFRFVGGPFEWESLSDPRAPAADRMAAAVVLTNVEEFERSKLVDPSQLPDLEPPPVVLTWDTDGAPTNIGFVLILADGREIWREKSWFENYRRFGEVAEILQRKYGTGLRDLVPTRRSEMDLWGDKLAAPSITDKVRAALGRGEALPRS